MQTILMPLQLIEEEIIKEIIIDLEILTRKLLVIKCKYYLKENICNHELLI